MKVLKRRCVSAAAAGTLAAGLLMGCSTPEVNHDEVVAVIGDAEVSYGVANFYSRMMQSRYENYYTTLTGETPAEFWMQQWGEESYENYVKSGLMEDLENFYILSQHADEYGVTVTEEEEKAIAKAAADFEEGNALEAKEVVSGYKKYIEEYLRLATIEEKMDVSMREGVDEEVSDEEAAKKIMKYVYFEYAKEGEDGQSETMSMMRRKISRKRRRSLPRSCRTARRRTSTQPRKKRAWK